LPPGVEPIGNFSDYRELSLQFAPVKLESTSKALHHFLGYRKGLLLEKKEGANAARKTIF
jgi:hypothetical protein